jgi:hypothetical protein
MRGLSDRSGGAFVGMVLAAAAQATIRPIVDSFDCANAQSFAHHPLGRPGRPSRSDATGIPGSPAFENSVEGIGRSGLRRGAVAVAFSRSVGRVSLWRSDGV